MKKICKVCGKELIKQQKVCCSNKCRSVYVQKYLKENKKSFYNFKLQKELNKKGIETNRKNKTGLFDPKVRERILKNHKKNKTGMFADNFSKLGNDTQKKLKTGFYNSELQSELGKRGAKKTHEICKKNKTGFWSSKSQSAKGKKGGVKAIKILRENKGYIFKKINFDSKSEMEIAMNIHYQFKIILKENKNYQVKVGSKLYDFFINNIFIEYHPINNFFHPNETNYSYYQKRRQNLNKNGYKDYPLIIIK